jgi:uncharacterized repeat protein (TIGR01451 family)
MNILRNYRRFIVNLIGIFPLVLSLWNTQPVFAATSTSDISITLVANQSKVKPGKTITYTAIMTNHGPNDAFFVDVRFNLPPQLTLVEETCAFGISPDTPFCEYSSLKAGETAVSTVVATPNPDYLTRERDLTVTADILFEQDCAVEPIDVDCMSDPDLSNNLAWVSTTASGKLAHP